MDKKLYFILISTLLLTILYSFTPRSSKSRIKYVGNYASLGNVYRKSDTISGALCITSDSFAIVYQIQADSDYLLPSFQGTWTVKDDTTLELKQGNIIMKCIVEMDAYGKYMTVDGYKFVQHYKFR